MPVHPVSGDLDSKVNRSGDIMTGILTLSANPVNPLDSATKQYVDNSTDGKQWMITDTTATTLTLSAANSNQYLRMKNGGAITLPIVDASITLGMRWVVMNLNSTPVTFTANTGNSILGTVTLTQNQYATIVFEQNTGGNIFRIMSPVDLTQKGAVKEWFVDSANGNDNNTGHTQYNAFATLDKAVTSSASGDVIRFIGAYTYSSNFTSALTRTLILKTDSLVTFSAGITNTNLNLTLDGRFTVSNTNGPALLFAGGTFTGRNITVSSTYNSSFTGTLAASVILTSSPSLFPMMYLESSIINISTPTLGSSLARVAAVYQTSAEPSTFTSRAVTTNYTKNQNGIFYNAFYSDSSNIYSYNYIENTTINETLSGQTSATTSDLFSHDGGCYAETIISEGKYVYNGASGVSPLTRIANSSSSNSCSMTIKNFKIIHNDAVLGANAQNTGDKIVFDGLTLISTAFTDTILTFTGSGKLGWSYMNSAAKTYNSNPTPAATGAWYLTIASPAASTSYSLLKLVGFSGLITKLTMNIETGSQVVLSVYKNGSAISGTSHQATTSSASFPITSGNSFVATDSIQIYVTAISGSPTNLNIALAYQATA